MDNEKRKIIKQFLERWGELYHAVSFRHGIRILYPLEAGGIGTTEWTYLTNFFREHSYAHRDNPSGNYVGDPDNPSSICMEFVPDVVFQQGRTAMDQAFDMAFGRR